VFCVSHLIVLSMFNLGGTGWTHKLDGGEGDCTE
jgi:hypothetical protein